MLTLITEALVNLLDFVDRFPTHFIGSNADLLLWIDPLNCQGRTLRVPMMRAEVAEGFELRQFPVAGAILK